MVSSMKRRTIALLFCVTWSLRLQHRFARIVPLLSGSSLLGESSHSMAFWQARFYDFNVGTTKKRVEKLRYMHRNPVKRGLVQSPGQWRWSSYRFYLLDETGAVR